MATVHVGSEWQQFTWGVNGNSSLGKFFAIELRFKMLTPGRMPSIMLTDHFAFNCLGKFFAKELLFELLAPRSMP
jgi:hypothetical protein